MSMRIDQKQLDKMHKGISEGVRKAVLEHKRAGRSISVWRNGRVERIPPEQILVSEEDPQR